MLNNISVTTKILIHMKQFQEFSQLFCWTLFKESSTACVLFSAGLCRISDEALHNIGSFMWSIQGLLCMQLLNLCSVCDSRLDE